MERSHFQGEVQHPRVYTGELEEIVHEAAPVRKLAAGRGEVALLRFPIGGDTVGDGFDEGPRGGERRAQVVGDGGYEVAPRLLHLALVLRRLP